MTPYEATKPSNAIFVNNTELQALFTRNYPELELGSNVKIYKTENIRTHSKS